MTIKILDHLRPLFASLALRPVLLAPVVLFLAIAWCGLGAGYGLPEQFWHETSSRQFLSGLGSSLLFAQVCLIAFLLDSRACETSPSGSLHQTLRFHMRRSWWVLVVLLGLSTAQDFPSRWVFLLGLLLPVVVVRVIVGVGFSPMEPDPATEPEETPPLPLWVEGMFHAPIAVIGVFAILLIPNAHLEWLCLTLSLWGAAHGGVLFAFRFRGMTGLAQRRIHLLAGFSFGVFFSLFLALFLLTWLGPDRATINLFATPILVVEVLLALLVTIHGFLSYHFRGWYALVLVFFAGVVALVNGPPRYKLHFPGLDYKQPVPLLQADFDGQFSQLLRRHANLEDGSVTDPDAEVGPSYAGLVASLESMHQRLVDRKGTLGKPNDDIRLDLPPWDEVRESLLAKRFSEAEKSYLRLRADNHRLGSVQMQMEETALTLWRDQAPAAKGQKPKLVLVAVSGGANRSALWTAHVLDKLENHFSGIHGPFARNVRLITGASGGMVGAAYWTATLREGKHGHAQANRDAFLDPVAGDNLTSLVRHAVFLDLPTVVLPGEFTRDRGTDLERSWSRHMGGALDVPFQSLAVEEWRGRRPSLIFSPMLVEDGRRLLISNLALPFLEESAGSLLGEDPPGEESIGARSRPVGDGKEKRRRPRPGGKPYLYDPKEPLDKIIADKRHRYSLSAVEFFRLFPKAKEFHLSTAARMSATFPYFSPAVDLPTTPRRRVVDAGYYDNYGVSVAANFLYARRKWLQDNTSGVVLIQLRDSSSEDRRLFLDKQVALWDYTRSVEWLTGPLVGAGSARESGMSFRNDELVGVLCDVFNDDAHEFFTTAVFESTEDIAVSWYLSPGEIASMKKGFGGRLANQMKLERLEKWWRENHGR